MKEKIKICKVCGRICGNKHHEYRDGMCNKHYTQFKKYGKCLDNNPRTVWDDNEIRILDNYAEIDTYTNTEIRFYPYADGIPYGTYRVYYTSKLFHGYKELFPVDDIDGGFIVKTTNENDTMNILYMFPNKDLNIIFGETPSAMFSLVISSD